MTVRRDPTKAMQIGFLALLSISAATVGWWMYDHVQYARSVEQRFASDPVVAEDSAARINRILWEGGFFLVVLIGGMAVLDAHAAARRGAAAAATELPRGRVARVQEPAREHPARGRNARAALARRRRQAARNAHSRGRRAPLAHDRQSARHHAARGRAPTLDAAAHESTRREHRRHRRDRGAHPLERRRGHARRRCRPGACTSTPSSWKRGCATCSTTR